MYQDINTYFVKSWNMLAFLNCNAGNEWITIQGRAVQPCKPRESLLSLGWQLDEGSFQDCRSLRHCFQEIFLLQARIIHDNGLWMHIVSDVPQSRRTANLHAEIGTLQTKVRPGVYGQDVSNVLTTLKT